MKNLSIKAGLVGFLGVFCAASVQAVRPDTDADVGIRQRLDSQVPLDLRFRDGSGSEIRLEDYVDGKPVLLALVYYECPMLCGLVLNGILETLNEVELTPGDEFNLIVVSIDPDEPHTLASSSRDTFLLKYDRPGSAEGTHFLVGEEPQIRELADAVGFQYQYVPDTQEYAHGSGIMILTAEGRLSRYFYGIEHSPRDLRLGLVEASENRIGKAIDRMLLLCYQYDAVSGTYGLLIMRVVNAACIATAGGLGLFLLIMVKREKRSRRAETGTPSDRVKRSER